MIRPLAFVVLGLIAGLALADHEKTTPDNVDHDHLAIQGYDPVAYFSGKPAEGSAKITAQHGGHTYRFASEENKRAFHASPDKYVPAYGGWCATAMAIKGTKVEINPKSFKIVNGRLMLFYKTFFGDALKDWNGAGKESELVAKADANWKKIAGGR